MKKRGLNYTQEQCDFMLQNFGKIATSEITKETGISATCVRKWICKQRGQSKSPLPTRIAKIGEERRTWCKTKRAYVVKVKTAAGKWKHVRYEGHEDKKSEYISALPIGTIRVHSDGKKRIKTEAGWRYMKLPESEKKKPGGIRKKIFKAGDIVERMHNGKKRKFIRMEDMRWKIIPQELPPKITRTPVEKTSKPIPVTKMQSKSTVNHNANPDKIKIPVQTGGHYVRLDSRTVVYRKF